jgi:CO/xanthine dehydrogenase Mo-binding subunit
VGSWIGAVGSAAAYCRVEPDGTLSVHVGTPDISGSGTALAIVAAETFGVTPQAVVMRGSDSTVAPESPTASGSQTVYSVSPAVFQAAGEAKRQVLELAGEYFEAGVDDLDLVDGLIGVRGLPERRTPLAEILALQHHPPIVGLGRAMTAGRTPAYTVHICRVSVDFDTGAVEVLRYAVIQDVGRAINPPEIDGQIHGGVLQGIGRALGERLVYDTTGQLRTGTFLDYELPTIDQAPAVGVTLVEVPSEHILGVRGVGEPPAIPGPAAIANAVAAATGLRIRRVPINPAELLSQLVPEL